MPPTADDKAVKSPKVSPLWHETARWADDTFHTLAPVADKAQMWPVGGKRRQFRIIAPYRKLQDYTVTEAAETRNTSADLYITNSC